MPQGHLADPQKVTTHTTRRKATSPRRIGWLIAVFSLFALVASGAGFSAAVAKTDAHTQHNRRGAEVAATIARAVQACHRTKAVRHEMRAKRTSVAGSCVNRRRTVTMAVRPPRPTEPVPSTPVPTAPRPTTPAPTTPKPTTPAPTTPTPKPTTPKPSTPAPVTPPPSGGIASAATTGVPSGTSLQAVKGDMNITTDGSVVDSKDISGNIWIDADDVTIRSSRIVGGGFSVIQVKNGSRNVTIENVEVDGAGRQPGSMGIMGPANVSGSDITGVENGLTPGSGSVLKGNYVHGLKSPGSPHYDGIQIDGGLSNITISGNYIDMSEHDQTSAVMIDNYFGPISNITVDGNHLAGGGYTVYSDGQFSGGSITGVSFTNNRLGKGQYGYASVVKNSPVWSNNTDASTGKAVTR